MSAELEIKMTSPESFLPFLRSMLENGDSVPVVVTGSSMQPFLTENRDSVWLSPVGEIKKGDIVFYERATGELILHRVLRVDGDSFYAVGDAQNYIEGPVPISAVLAVAESANRKGRRITRKNAVWRFYRYVWINLVPLRPQLIKIAVRFLRKRK